MALIDRYRFTDRMRDSLARIEAGRSMLETHLDAPEGWHGAIKKEVMASVVHYSTKIEGNRLTREQVESIISGESIEAPDKDKVEATNYYQAMRWAQSRVADERWRATHETILTVHFLVAQNLGPAYEPLGRYREDQNNVSDLATGHVIYWPPRRDEVRPLMDEFVPWMRRQMTSDSDPYVFNALAHLNFVAIHPFSDGNGRVARVLCSLLMMRVGYKAQAFYSLEEYFGVNWQEYGERISSCLGPRWNPQVDCTDWIEWYLDAIATQVSLAESGLERSFGQLAVILCGLQGSDRPIRREALALWLANRTGAVANRSYRSIAEVAPETASRDLQRLAKEGYLLQRGAKRGSHYVVGPRMAGWGDIGVLTDLYLEGGEDPVVAAIGGLDQPTLFDAP